MQPRAAQVREETLDPEDWADAQAVAHRAVDDAIAYLRDIRDRPVWQDMPCEVRRTFDTHLPRSPTPLSEVYGEISETVMPYPMGNIHPRFWGWVNGTGTPIGLLAELLTAGMNFLLIATPSNVPGGVVRGSVQNVEGPLSSSPLSFPGCQIQYFNSTGTPVNFRFRFTITGAVQGQSERCV